MPNKHFCQGPSCHTNPTSDRFLKSKGIIRGRYAYSQMDSNYNGGYGYGQDSDKYFCSQGCKNSWLNTNMESIARRTLPPFIEHRRVSEGYQKVTNRYNYGIYSSIQKIGVDNNAQ